MGDEAPFDGPRDRVRERVGGPAGRGSLCSLSKSVLPPARTWGESWQRSHLGLAASSDTQGAPPPGASVLFPQPLRG